MHVQTPLLLLQKPAHLLVKLHWHSANQVQGTADWNARKRTVLRAGTVIRALDEQAAVAPERVQALAPRIASVAPASIVASIASAARALPD